MIFFLFKNNFIASGNYVVQSNGGLLYIAMDSYT